MDDQAEVVARQLWKALGVDVTKQQKHDGLSVAMLDELDYGLLLVDSALVVIHKNLVAGKILDRSSLLSFRGRTISCPIPSNRNSLLVAVKKAITHSTQSFLTLRDSVNRLNLVVVPVDDASGEPRALVKTERLPQPEGRSVIEFARARCLSPSTTEVLLELVDGANIPEIAIKLNLAQSTIRTLIKEIRERTETSSIRQLMLEVANLPPMKLSNLARNEGSDFLQSESEKTSDSMPVDKSHGYLVSNSEVVDVDYLSDRDTSIFRVAEFLFCEDLFQEDYSCLKLHQLMVAGLPLRFALSFFSRSNILNKVLLEHLRSLDASVNEASDNARLSESASEWLWRTSKVLLYAIDAFGDQSRAEEWLLKPAPYFRGEKPISLLQSAFGETIVSEYLERIISGVLV